MDRKNTNDIEKLQKEKENLEEKQIEQSAEQLGLEPAKYRKLIKLLDMSEPSLQDFFDFLNEALGDSDTKLSNNKKQFLAAAFKSKAANVRAETMKLLQIPPATYSLWKQKDAKFAEIMEFIEIGAIWHKEGIVSDKLEKFASMEIEEYCPGFDELEPDVKARVRKDYHNYILKAIAEFRADISAKRAVLERDRQARNLSSNEEKDVQLGWSSPESNPSFDKPDEEE